MKLLRVSSLVLALSLALTPAPAEEDRRNLFRGKSAPGSKRLQAMSRLSTVSLDTASTPNGETSVSTRLPNHAIWVAPPPLGNNATGNGTETAPYATIQVALIRSSSGDQIRVLPGTYNECINNTQFALGVQKNLEIVADDWIVNGDRTTTIINGAGQCAFPFSVVNLAGSPPVGSAMEGFTVTGGTASGVFVLGSGVITNNLVTQNTSLDGAGVYVYAGTCFYGDSNVLVSDNQITLNTADDQGECNPGGEPCVTSANCGTTGAECLFSGGWGGGVFVNADAVNSGGDAGCEGGDTSIRIDGNVIDGNGADGVEGAFGGGLYALTNTQSNRLSTVRITQNLISNNTMLPFSLGYGGGAWFGTFGYGTEQIDFVNNTVTSNTSTGDGGGISAWIDSLIDANHTINVSDNDIQLNSADGGGGGMDLFLFARDVSGSSNSIRLAATGNLVAGNRAIGTELTLLPGVGGGIANLLWSQWSTVADLEVAENEVRNNTSSVAGGGISVVSIADADPDEDGAVKQTGASALIRNNLVATNEATGALAPGGAADSAVGGGILAYVEAIGGFSLMEPAESRIQLIFNTVAENTSDTGSGGIELESHTAEDFNGADGTAEIDINHSILYGNSGYGIGGPMPSVAGVIPPRPKNVSPPGNTGNLDVVLRWNSLFLNDLGPFEGWLVPLEGPGHLFGDPLLGGNYRPSQCSATIDAGNPLISPDLEPAPNGGLVNFGHTGATSLAVTTLADANGDGAVDGVDLLRLAVAFGADPVNLRWDPFVDLDRDNFISGVDLALLAADFAQSCP